MNCDDGIHTNVPVTFGLGGGLGLPVVALDDIPVGTVCTVVEQGTGSFPAGTVVTYDPVGADTPGVTIGATGGVVVNIVNDFSEDHVVMADVTITKAVTPAPGVDPPASFSAAAQCGDGTNVTITLPGAGGAGTPSPQRSDALALRRGRGPGLGPGRVDGLVLRERRGADGHTTAVRRRRRDGHRHHDHQRRHRGHDDDHRAADHDDHRAAGHDHDRARRWSRRRWDRPGNLGPDPAPHGSARARPAVRRRARQRRRRVALMAEGYRRRTDHGPGRD